MLLLMSLFYQRRTRNGNELVYAGAICAWHIVAVGGGTEAVAAGTLVNGGNCKSSDTVFAEE